jgi:phosphoribosylaminoimidazole-succinocarboxamide synthase
MENGFMGRPGEKVPEMTPEVCKSISDRYIELYEHVTGKKFVKAEDGDAAKRIEANVVACLNKLNK